MTSFTQNYWGQRDIINKIIIFTKRVTDTIHALIPTKYQKYPSTTTLKHEKNLDKVNKLPNVRLLHTKPHAGYNIKIHVLTITISDISHEQKD